MIKILTVTTHYPTVLLPHDGFSIHKIATELKKSGAINQQIIVPLPDFPHFKKFFKPYEEYEEFPEKLIHDGIEVHHPRYFIIPGGYFANTASSMAKVIEEKIASLKPDLIEGQYLYPAGIVAFKVAKNNELPLILTIRDADPERWLDNKKIGSELREAADYSSKIICETETIRDTLLSYDFPPEKIVVIKNGIDLDHFNLSAKANPLREKYFLSVGRLTTEKAHHVTLNAFAGIQKERLIIVGDGNQRRALKKQAADLGIKGRVQFIKHLEQSKLAEFYAGATATILMAYDEGMINTAHESLATGTPVIAPEVGDVDQLINDSNGVLLKENDDYHLIEATKDIKRSDYKRENISNSNKNSSWSETAQKFQDIYLNITS